MAKINIPFNNTNYSIDESSLSAASAALKNHLQTVMNGSGAVINLGGVSYSIDSTKLSSATNAFITHLGAIAGSGKKVVVNGVEYAVDSAKMNDAIAQIHNVLGNLHPGNEGSGEVEVIFAEQKMRFLNRRHTRPEYCMDFSKYSEVTVIWNGTEWKVTPIGEQGAYLVGNASLNDAGDDTGEPFLIVIAPPEFIGNDTGMTQFVARDANEVSYEGWDGSDEITYNTFAIYGKLL